MEACCVFFEVRPGFLKYYLGELFASKGVECVELFVTQCLGTGEIFIACTVLMNLFCSDVGDSPSDHVQEDMDSEVYPSEDGKCIVLVRRGK
jgi:hypothetical protein